MKRKREQEMAEVQRQTLDLERRQLLDLLENLLNEKAAREHQLKDMLVRIYAYAYAQMEYMLYSFISPSTAN